MALDDGADLVEPPENTSGHLAVSVTIAMGAPRPRYAAWVADYTALPTPVAEKFQRLGALELDAWGQIPLLQAVIWEVAFGI